MNINSIDLELNVKMIETLKFILKDLNVNISFEKHNNIDELSNITLDGYNFRLYRYSEDIIKKIPKKYKFLWFTKYKTITEKVDNYKLNYNNIIIDLNKLTYDKLYLYVNYVYKLKQLITLNKKLGVDQEIIIKLEDDVLLENMYNSFYIYFNKIIKDI